jgi:hypothetical protein
LSFFKLPSPYFELFEQLLVALESQQKMAVSENALQTMLQNFLKEAELPVTRQVKKTKPQTVSLNFFNSSHTFSIGRGLSEFGDVNKKTS